MTEVEVSLLDQIMRLRDELRVAQEKIHYYAEVIEAMSQALHDLRG
jgi:hypothetical protein